MNIKIMFLTLTIIPSPYLFAAAAKPVARKYFYAHGAYPDARGKWVFKTITFGSLEKSSQTCTFELSTVYDANEKESVETAKGKIQPSLWDVINAEIQRGELSCSNPNHSECNHKINKTMTAKELVISIPGE